MQHSSPHLKHWVLLQPLHLKIPSCDIWKQMVSQPRRKKKKKKNGLHMHWKSLYIGWVLGFSKLQKTWLDPLYFSWKNQREALILCREAHSWWLCLNLLYSSLAGQSHWPCSLDNVRGERDKKKEQKGVSALNNWRSVSSEMNMCPLSPTFPQTCFFVLKPNAITRLNYELCWLKKCLDKIAVSLRKHLCISLCIKPGSFDLRFYGI